MNKSTNWLMVVVIMVLIVITFTFGAIQKTPNTLEKVTVGFQPSVSAALLMVAKERGFFSEEGVDVSLREFTAGKFAFNAFLGGSLDFCVSGDVPPMLAALQGNRFIVPAQLVQKTNNEIRVVARKDGNDNAQKYFTSKKRKLATSIGGGPEFFSYEFLNKLGINKDEIEIISQKPEDMTAALVNGSVDAIAIFDPVSYVAEKQMGDRAVTFTDDSVYSELYVVEARESVRQNPELLKKFLKALVLAEDFAKDNPQETKTIVAKYTKLDVKTIDGIWENYKFGVSLTPQLTEYWNREVSWAKATGKTPNDTKVPDWGNYIFRDVLKEINPAAVTI